MARISLANFFTALSYGELSNENIGNDGEGTIPLALQPRVVNYVNKTLTTLHTRFVCVRDFAELTLSAGTLTYDLEVMDPDFIKVLGIRNEDAEFEVDKDVWINRRRSTNRVRMLSSSQIRIDDPEDGCVLTVEYQKNHPRFSLDPVDQTQMITLAPPLMEALETHVAARIIGSRGGEANMTRSQKLLNDYETICQWVESQDMLQTSSSSDYESLEQKGFL